MGRTDYKRTLVLRAVYNNSDSMTDYFQPRAWYKTYKLYEMPGKILTEKKLRDAMKTLPDWLRKLEWKKERTYYDTIFLESEADKDLLHIATYDYSRIFFTIDASGGTNDYPTEIPSYADFKKMADADYEQAKMDRVEDMDRRELRRKQRAGREDEQTQLQKLQPPFSVTKGRDGGVSVFVDEIGLDLSKYL